MNNNSNGFGTLIVGLIAVVALGVGLLALTSAGKATHDAGAIATQTSTAGYYNAGLGFKLNGTAFVALNSGATSTLAIGCITRYATSSATAVKDVFVATTTLGTSGVGVWAVQYGTCP